MIVIGYSIILWGSIILTKTLYLMRHGQTLFNQLKRIQGACDSPLTAQGITEAQSVSRYFKQQGLKFDHAYASTQERAVDTLELVTKQSYQRLKGLKEWNFGVFEGESEVLNPKFSPGQLGYGDYFVQFGGESGKQVQERMVQTLTEIMARPDHQQVLAVSHGGASYMFLQRWLDATKMQWRQIRVNNCAVLKFLYDDGKFEFVSVRNLDD